MGSQPPAVPRDGGGPEGLQMVTAGARFIPAISGGSAPLHSRHLRRLCRQKPKVPRQGSLCSPQGSARRLALPAPDEPLPPPRCSGRGPRPWQTILNLLKSH